jgi:predicted amino acid racemase
MSNEILGSAIKYTTLPGSPIVAITTEWKSSKHTARRSSLQMKKMSSKVIREPNNIFGENIKADGIRHVVNVTIDTAKEFHNCNHLYIRYVVDAPAGSNSVISDGIYYIHQFHSC